MNQGSSPQGSKPWYKIPYFWLMVAIPASSIVLGGALVATAWLNADDVVADDWYKQGRTINRSLEDEEIARRFGLAVNLSLNEKTTAELSATTAIPWPDTLTLALRHPAFAKRDVVAELQHEGNGLYSAEAANYEGDEAIVTITPTDKTWRLQQRVSLDTGIAEIKAKGKK